MTAPEASGATENTPTIRAEASPASPEGDWRPAAERYSVESELGRGGMGVVYRAFDRDLQRPVALKVLRHEDDATRARRFVEEARAAAQLEHPGIVPVYDVGLGAGGRPYFAMKLVEGRTLAEASGEMTRFRRIQVLVEVARAVAYAHERGVVHRDLKPQNVMMGRHGEVLVLDWGLARRLDSDATAERGLAGTRGYIAPELLEGRPAGPPADIFALGTTLSHVLAGGAPGEAIPPELEAICRKAREARPEDRYASASAFADDLESFLEHRPVSAYDEPLLARAAKWARRNRGLVRAGAAVLLAIALGAGAAMRRERTETLASFVRQLDGAEARLAAADLPLEARMGAALDALQAASQLAIISPENRPRAFRASMDLARLAMQAEQWGLARSALEKALALEVDAPGARAALEEVERGRTRIQEEHRAAVARILAAAASGEQARRPRGHEDALFALMSYREPQTVSLLAAALDGVTERLHATADATILSAEPPTPVEVTAGTQPIAGLGPALAALRARGDDLLLAGRADPALAAAFERLELRAMRARAEFEADDVPRIRQIVARAQELALGAGGVALARLCCEALDRLRLPERAAIDALGRHAVADADPVRAAAAGIALAAIGGPDAHRWLRRARDLHGPQSAFWRRAKAILGPDFGPPDPDPATLLDPDAAIARDPRDPDAYYRRALARYDRNDDRGALEDASRAIDLDATDPRYLRLRAAARREMDEHRLALADASRAIELDPGAPESWIERAQARFMLNDYGSALADAERAIELAPALDEAWTMRGRVRYYMGDLEGAIADLTRAVELDPDGGASYEWRGEAYAGLKRYDEALRDLDRAVQLEPERHWIYLGRGKVRHHAGDKAGALADADRVIELKPHLYDGWLLRADVRHGIPELDAALADVNRAVARGPDQEDVYRVRAAIHESAGRLPEALADYSKAVELDPANAWTLVFRADVRVALGEIDAAMADYTRALELDPRFAEGWNNRGDTHLLREDYASALADANRAVELAPEDPLFWVTRGDARTGLGDVAGAIADYERSIALGIGGVEEELAERVRADLKKLRRKQP